jgi:hypothetical protein
MLTAVVEHPTKKKLLKNYGFNPLAVSIFKKIITISAEKKDII